MHTVGCLAARSGTRRLRRRCGIRSATARIAGGRPRADGDLGGLCCGRCPGDARAAENVASSEHGRRYFCPDCGTGLFYTSEAHLPGLIDVQTARLDEPHRIVAPTAQVQVTERIGWMADAHALQAFDRYPG